MEEHLHETVHYLHSVMSLVVPERHLSLHIRENLRNNQLAQGIIMPIALLQQSEKSRQNLSLFHQLCNGLMTLR